MSLLDLPELGKLSGRAIGGPRYFRYDTDQAVAEGDWLFQPFQRTECGERWYIVLSVRPVKARGPIPRTYRWSLTCQEVQTPTSADPSIPEDLPEEFERLHTLSLYARPRHRWRQTR